MTEQYTEPRIPSVATGRRTAHVLAALVAPEAPSTSAVPLSPSLRRDTAVLEVDNPSAPNGKTQVQPPASMRSLAASMYPLIHIIPSLEGATVKHNTPGSILA